MQLPAWTHSKQKRRRRISSAERRRRDELFIPLEVGPLEPRRVLAGFTFNIAPVLTAGGGSLTPIPQNISAASNSGNLVSHLVSATSDTGLLGIAITGTNNGGSTGAWQYSTNGTTWINVGTVSNTSALLLDGADYVRFAPGSPYTSSASITFRAWDESSGTIASYVSTASNGGTTAFSNTTTSSSITIAPTLSVSGTGPTSLLDDQTAQLFDNGAVNATIGDSNPSDLLTITIAQQLSGGTTDSTLADGSLAGGGFVNNGNGTYTLGGVTAAVATTDLQALVFTPTRGTPGVALSTTFQIQVTDSFAPLNTATDANTVATVTGNVTPILNGAKDFAPIVENATSVPGKPVSELIAGETIDANDNMLGIAVTTVDNTNGQWEYSTDDSTWFDLGGDTIQSAFLLDNADYLRFVPASGFTGKSSIGFVAWDGTGGTHLTTDDTTQYPGSGAFSIGGATASVTVYPSLSILGTGTTAILDDQTAQPFDNGAVDATIGDSNASDLLTITVTQQLSGGGTDSTLADGSLSGGGFVNNHNGAYTLSGVTAAVATADLQSLVFTPTRGTPDVPLSTTFQIQVTDSFAPLNTVTDANTVTTVTGNVTPVLSGAKPFAPIVENTTSVPGMQVSALIAGETTDANDNMLGIAVTAVSNANGQWEYSTDDSTWFDLGGNTAQSAFLLDNGDYLRFVPNAGFTGMSSITFVAWDGTSGTHLTTDDTTQYPGSGAFSAASATSSVTVYPSLSISGTGTTAILDDQTVQPFDHGAVDATIGDSDSSDLLTITITQELPGGATDSTLADGSLSGSGFVNNGNGTYTLNGVTASVATTDLQSLVFTPTRGTPGIPLSTTFQIQATDSFAPLNTVTDANTVTTVTGNVTPVLSGAKPFAPIVENTTSVPGMQVSALIAGETTDANDNMLGIAVTAVSNANGQWEYSTDDSTWFDLGGNTIQSAFLLDNGDYLRFVPNAGFTGMSSITFVAWDGTSGTHLTTDDTTQYPGSGAFSAASATSSVTVYPSLSISGTGTTAILDDQTVQPFDHGAVDATIGDSDSSDLVAITITQQLSGGGTDSTLADGSLSGTGFVNNGNGTYTLSGVTAAVATADLQSLVFTPTRGTPGVPLSTTFQIQVTDSFAPLNTVTDANTVTTVTGDAVPVLTGANNLPAVPENVLAANDSGSTVASLISHQSSDPDGDPLGIAVTGLSESAGSGVWQYSTDGGSSWSAIDTSVSATSALLLAPTDRVRFLPNDGFIGNPVATITFLAWDQTTGVADTLDDTTQLPGAGGFSINTATATETIFPVLSISGTGASSIKDDQSVQPFANGSVDATIGDSDAADMLTITITQQAGGATDTTQINGTLESSDNFAGFVDNANGTYTLTVAASDASAELQSLVFIPNQGLVVGQIVDTTFQIAVADSYAAFNNTAVDSGTVVHVTTTTNPTLTGSSNLSPIPENEPSALDSGKQVSDLPIGAGGSSGIAVSAVDDTNGTWEYSTDGTTWTAIDLTGPPHNMVGPPAPQYVFLLAPTDFVRFLPNAGFTGTSTIIYRAWDQDSGQADALAPEIKPLTGTLSHNSETASITVYPVISIAGTGPTTSLDDQTSQPFQTATIGDTVTTETVTITITQINTATHLVDSTYADGSLSSPNVAFTSDALGVYTLTVAASDATADLQALIFAPTLHQELPGQTVATQFVIQVADANFAPINTVVDQASILTVTANAIPQLNGANNLPSIPENVATVNDSGVTVASLIDRGKSSDSDGDALGVAISTVDDTNGEWDYSTGAGQPWIAISSVSPTSALLLAPTDMVRFLPNANFFGNSTIQFSAWDQTVGAPTKLIDPAVLPGAGAFSINMATASIQVVAPATIFVLTPAQATNDETPVNVFASAFGSPTIGLPAPGITDPNTPIQDYTVTVTIGTPANGVFQYPLGSGWSSTVAGVYKFTGSAADANLALEELVFVPTIHQVEPGDSVVTDFTISVNDGVTAPTSNGAVSLTATAVNDAPTFAAPSVLFNVPVLAGNGAVVGTAVATEVDFDPNISYAITAGNPSGAYAINSSGTITVANSAALSYSATPTVLTITATNSGANGVAPAVRTSTRSIALWEITASASAIGADSSTTLSLALISGVPLTVPVTIHWGDTSTTQVTLSSTQATAPILHLYIANPNSADPAAPIPINVLYSAVGEQFDTQTLATVDGTGIGFIVIPHVTTSFVALAPPPTLETAPTMVPVELPITDSTDTGVAQVQITVGDERRLVLRILSPLGVEGGDIQLPDRVLNDLPSLFKKLPDGHYRIYLAEDGRERLVIDVMVRQGRPVDSSEDTGGTGDRPPTSQIETDNPARFAGINPAEPKTQAGTTLEKQSPNSGRPVAGDGHRAIRTAARVDGRSAGTTTPGAAQIVASLGLATGRGMSMKRTLSLHEANLARTIHKGSNPLVSSEVWAPEIRASSAAAGSAMAATATLFAGPKRRDQFMAKLTKRSLSKAARLSRRLKRTAADAANERRAK